MDEIFGAIGDAFGDLLADPTVGLVLRLGAAYIVVVWLAVALWAFVDMRRRSSSVIAPYGSAALVLLFSPVLFPLALVVHWLIRPETTFAERRMHEIRDAALLAETADDLRCPECRTMIEEDWLLCPACRRTLGHHCPRCGRTAALDWAVCAWCGTDFDAAPRIEIARV